MDNQTKADYQSHEQKLRSVLKSWENSWAKSHDGKKPGREDIKRNADIAQKYKQYNKVRDILSGKVPLPAKEDPKAEKRKDDPAPATTPSKRQKHAGTPSKRNSNVDDAALISTPSISKTLFSPAALRSIGPTPQRDGRVLGLFDLMIERELRTPSRSNGNINRRTDCEARPITTPRKRANPMDEESVAKLGRTPISTSKRQMLDSFMTPLKNKEGILTDAKTPTTVSKLQFSTPLFLKRHTQPHAAENNDSIAPPLRLPRKPMVRGLSAIVATLRKVEEEQLDDDLEALREAEGGHPQPKAPPKPNGEFLAADSQVHLPLGGFDDEGMYDSPDEEQLDRDGKPLRVFKKKGQKRTTRRVNMKPNIVKRPAASVKNGTQDEDDEVASETQAIGIPDDLPDELAGECSDSDFNDATPNASNSKKTKKVATVKKAVRKVNEMAHANFRRLKLKNNGAKGGPGYNSKFRRRR